MKYVWIDAQAQDLELAGTCAALDVSVTGSRLATWWQSRLQAADGLSGVGADPIHSRQIQGILW